MLRDHREPVKTSDGGNHARNRPRRQALGHKGVDEIFEVAAIELLNGLSDACGKFAKALEIAAVTFEGVIREPSLHLQMRHIGVDEIVGG
jgi:hypothetical protein